MKRILAAMLAMVLAGAAREARANEPLAYMVIVNAAVKTPSVSKADVRDLFAKKLTRWPDDGAVTPFDLTPNAPLRAAFSAAVYNKSPQAVLSEWRQRIFTGQGTPPREVKDEASMIAAVAATAGGLGYVRVGTALPPQVRILTVGN
ncbi:MAG: hypothetical protein ACAI38_07650 [Myxococcota bacterium]